MGYPHQRYTLGNVACPLCEKLLDIAVLFPSKHHTCISGFKIFQKSKQFNDVGVGQSSQKVDLISEALHEADKMSAEAARRMVSRSLKQSIPL